MADFSGIFVMSTVLLTLLSAGLGFELHKLLHDRRELISYINELLEEASEDPTEKAYKGARLAVENSSAVEFANPWLAAMPSDTIKDFVVKMDGWDEKDWTMWIRLPWGKYQEHKAEIDFAMGRNIMKEAHANEAINI